MSFLVQPLLRNFLNAQGMGGDRPNATSSGGSAAAQDGVPVPNTAFKALYIPPTLSAPRTDAEAQALYNHLRTASFFLDAMPLLTDSLHLPFGIGLDSVIGFVPGVGDWIGLVLSLYCVWLASLFKLPQNVITWMLIFVFVDAFVGMIPFVGDALDVAFKANLHNLSAFEAHLLRTGGRTEAGTFSIAFPPFKPFLPTLPEPIGVGVRTSEEPTRSLGSAAWRRTAPPSTAGAGTNARQGGRFSRMPWGSRAT
ncbi:hypothetical protein IE81DRAFT_367166 [Ceraceosorus guamensis]|uniref:Uncharacterized protein n=1 Tax=Ceraceosorus guamensis TaxID=1522189 RepID=A0A316VY35_9BASI|nr:hypothetical protein IE81DRAFT_367166 [Ceraceosorus guamensis]PWN41818.1 hypothetical protein IE81DRAFT_367166 [Ceraceosorus guamensis]